MAHRSRSPAAFGSTSSLANTHLQLVLHEAGQKLRKECAIGVVYQWGFSMAWFVTLSLIFLI